MFEIIFWSAILVISYIYVGYPLLLALLTSIRRNRSRQYGNHFPTVTLIVAAHNEEKVIAKKLQNILDLNYPRERLNAIIVSDGCTDRTNEIVGRYAGNGIRLITKSKRHGKTACQNIGAEMADGEVLVFSDANAIYRRDTVTKLVRHFDDNRVGCVCGELRYKNDSASSAGDGEELYWRYERFLKDRESRLSSLIGVNGSVYAIRKDCYVPLDDGLISDLVEPLLIYMKGFKIVYEKEAISEEDANHHMEDELKRKVRIVTRGIRGLLYTKSLLNPLKWGVFSIQIISHKLLRWLVPYLLLAILMTNLLLLDRKIFQLSLVVQIMFYAGALVGYYLEKRKCAVCKLLMTPLYFSMVNFAALVGWLKVIRREPMKTWSPLR
jgi:cellulose synthase/poly-beta-1,6-N-acetylglucosamine synthase-like glycosyltransferase